MTAQKCAISGHSNPIPFESAGGLYHRVPRRFPFVHSQIHGAPRLTGRARHPILHQSACSPSAMTNSSTEP